MSDTSVNYLTFQHFSSSLENWVLCLAFFIHVYNVFIAAELLEICR